MQSFRKNGQPFRSSPSYPSFSGQGRLRNFDIMGLFAAIAGVIGIFIEIYLGALIHHVSVPVSHYQHVTMYFFFVLFGSLSLLKPVLTKNVPEIEDVCYLTLAMSFFVEGILFKFHLFGRDNLDVVLHTLLIYVIFLSVLITLVEIKYKNSVLVTLSRAYLTLLQGTWFWQLAFILYNPIHGITQWDSEKHENMMLVVCIFTWHMAAVLLGMMGIGMVIAFINRRSQSYPYITGLSMQATSGNGYVSLLDQSNDVESVE